MKGYGGKEIDLLLQVCKWSVTTVLFDLSYKFCKLLIQIVFSNFLQKGDKLK